MNSVYFNCVYLYLFFIIYKPCDWIWTYSSSTIYTMVSNKSVKDRFFQSCITGDLDTIKADLFYNVSPFIQDKVAILGWLLVYLNHIWYLV